MPAYFYRGNPADDIDTLERTGVISPLVFGLFVPAAFIIYGVMCIEAREAVWFDSWVGHSPPLMGRDAVFAGIALIGIGVLISARFGWHRVPLLRRIWELGFVAGLVTMLIGVIGVIAGFILL